ncbi:MAG: D-alanine--D-alanine ligase [Zymomonas mobilis subsp. pomaceae]|uniref:D-alanine--D-alanine ligase n=1 Tax=Zymomonas mobilis subsp. pomaceae (strain ATCC 29192 / DSM 22645 / JCM 10191 / CCUG 17912 / NBRC 13757 / NCIMB 11200 / NRRL B-4491 / Barker I) TaxID=579138 RepID=F8EVC5_ZYMMT|nr:D-alanine--D-alanine ligase [Zymomonas mobilis]AEI37332.1 D-alanine/D-alanine ligase [Zymomonas mobilis subsp. pomaceae ATCC 29192]MDX5948700.1 D-alanine--D-alanine ligase [Zymomonas mobilis subsp. pomaceae]GEB88505.1 D-alanine--D-alanine ligase [Zymomonas mobilis subsp. pomaceae]
MIMKKHVAVLMGGWSSEREISLLSGQNVAQALKEAGYHVTSLDMDRDVAFRLKEINPDVVFNALHGTPGEDGSIQGMMDLMGICYTHSGMATSAIAIDKVLTKKILTPENIPMPEGVIVSSDSLYQRDPLPRPYVLKPVNEGSSVGVAIIDKNFNDGQPIREDQIGPWQKFEHLLAESFIKGKELTVAVMGDKALGVTELRPSHGFYDYEAKYTDGLTTHICPADIPLDIAEKAMTLACKAHQILGCKGPSRSDFRWDDEAGLEGLFLLEVNTQPGMTPLSLVPEQAKQLGISYQTLCCMIIEEALILSSDNCFNEAEMAGQSG